MIIKNSKALISMSLVVFIFFQSLAIVNGLGLSPADKKMNFQPGQDIILDFNIINSEQNNFEAGLSASGDLRSIIFFEDNTIQIEKDDYRTPFKVIIRFPPEMEPGLHTGAIKVTPLVPAAEGKTVSAFISIQAPIYVRVPYPAKYLELGLRVLDVDEGTPVPVYVQLDNIGSEDIDQAWAELKIYTPKQDLLHTLSTREVAIPRNTLREVQTLTNPVLRKGLYSAVVKAFYDGFEKTLEANFTLGKPFIRITRLITTELGRDGINRVLFRAYNEWNTELSVSGFVSINEQQTEMPVFQLSEEEEKQAPGFFDTTGLEPGEYNLSITLLYAGHRTTETFPVVITEEMAVLYPERQLRIWIITAALAFVIFITLALIVRRIIKRRKLAGERNL